MRIRSLWREVAFPVGVNIILCVSLVHVGGKVSAEVAPKQLTPRIEAMLLMPYSEDANYVAVQDAADVQPQQEEQPQQDPPPDQPPPDQPPADPPTDTPQPDPPTDTPVPTETTAPTDTPVPAPPTNTSVPPTDTPKPPPTETNTPKPTRTATPTKTSTPVRPPTVEKFAADRMSVPSGGAAVLSWEVYNATRVQIFPGFDALSPFGNITVNPQGNTTYVLHACNHDTCTDRSLMILTGPAEPTPAPVYVPPPLPTDTPVPTPRPNTVREMFEKLAAAWPGSCPP